MSADTQATPGAEKGKPPARPRKRRAAAAKGGGSPAPPPPPTPRRLQSADLLAVAALLLGSLAACNVLGGGEGAGTQAAAPAPPTGEIELHFLDVGQGDAVLLRTPEGKVMLYDGGRSREILRAHLARLNITGIDLMVASHADFDHIGGLVGAAEDFPPTVFLNNGLAHTTQAYSNLIDALERGGSDFAQASDDTVELGSVRLNVLAPPPGMGGGQNENSVGVMVEFGEFRALLTGDSELRQTRAWLNDHPPERFGPVQVYKSIHHGADNGDHADWLAAVRPENVVVSVGANNPYGHPSEAVLALYREHGATVFRTDEHGSVTVRATSDGAHTVTPERP